MADLRNRGNVLVGAPDVSASGGVSIGAVVTDVSAFPTKPSDDLTTKGFKPGGYITEDGVTKTVDRSTEKIKDWNGDTVVITQSDHSVTLQTTFMESANAEILKLIAGDANVTVTTDTVSGNEVIKVVDTADELPHRALAFKIKGNQNSKILVFAPDAQVTEVGDVTYVKNDVIKYQVTFECFGVEGQKLVSLIERPTAP